MMPGNRDKQTDLLNRQKRMLWRARHRGMKEMDLMLGEYAKHSLANMSVEQLDEFEVILEISDAYLLDWLTGKTDTPVEFQTEMFAQIKAQSFITDDYKKL